MNADQSLATKKDLKEIEQKLGQKLSHQTQGFMDFLTQFTEVQAQQWEDFKIEMRAYNAALVEDAEERFLRTGHDQASLNSDRLNNHDGRIRRLEKAVF